MSWEHLHYRAVCDSCGHEGVQIHSSDDWNHTETTYEGFDLRPPSAYAVGRKRAGPNDRLPTCPKCGGTAITHHELLKRT